MLDALRIPHRFREVRRRYGRRPFRLLDVGAGNHSASLAKRWFPGCHYAGIDRDRNYHNDAADFAAMDEFFEMDLTRLEFGAIPDAGYDVPQFSIHRGRLQAVIYHAARARIGESRIRTGHRLGGIRQDESGVTAYFFDRHGAHRHTLAWRIPCPVSPSSPSRPSPPPPPSSAPSGTTR